MAQFKDHFSGHADSYHEARPTYPDALFDWLAQQAPDRELAWDAGCGNGQATTALAQRFGRVFARMQRGHVAMLLSTLAEGIGRGEIDATIPPPLLLLSCLGLGALPQIMKKFNENVAREAAQPEITLRVDPRYIDAYKRIA